MNCRRCRQPITTTHRSWLRIERGALLPDGTTATSDRNYCGPECLIADTEPETNR